MVRSVICRRSQRVQRLSLEKDALSFLHPRVVLHQLRVEERILRDDVLDPLDQAVCGESRVQKGALHSPPLGGHSQRWKPGPEEYAFVWHIYSITGRGPCSRDFCLDLWAVHPPLVSFWPYKVLIQTKSALKGKQAF